MSIGDKTRRAYAKAYNRLQMQEGDVIIRQKIHAAPSVIGGTYSTTTQTDITLTNKCEVKQVNSYEVRSNNLLKLEDLRFTFPGQFATEAQIKSSVILYKGLTFTIVYYAPLQIVSNEVMEWSIYGRAEG